MKKIILPLLLFIAANAYSEKFTIEFVFHTTAEVAQEPRLVKRETRMEVTFDSETGKGKVKSYSPFSDSFETKEISVMPVDKGMHFIENKNNGFGVISFSLQSGEASYSNANIFYGTLTSYQLYGKGRILEER